MAKFGIALGSGPRGHGFKSRHSDQNRVDVIRYRLCFYFRDLNPKRVRSVKKTVQRTVFSSEVRDGYCRFGGGRREWGICAAKTRPVTPTKTELMSSDIGSVFILGDLNPKRVRSVKKTVR